MKNIVRMILTGFVVFIFLTTGASAVTYNDTDGDGICEPCEEITFEGDISYIDDQGNEHWFSMWEWDFDSDGTIDATGRVVKHTFDTEGVYKITLKEINADGFLVVFEIEVKSDQPNPDPEPEPKPEQVITNAIDELEAMKPTGDRKLDKGLDKTIKELNKALKEFEKDKPSKAYHKIAKAIKHLEKVQKKGGATQDIIDNLIDLV